MNARVLRGKMMARSLRMVGGVLHIERGSAFNAGAQSND